MRRRVSTVCAVAAAAGLALGRFGVAAAPAADETGETILTRDTKFAIPVDVAGGDSDRYEVRLYVSDDAGKTWRLHERAKPPIERFSFQAPGDDEYCFHVRTVDTEGTESPSEAMTVDLRVVVDSTPPRIELRSQRLPDGSLLTRWRSDDAHPAPDTLKLTYRSTQGGELRSVTALRTKRQGDDRDGFGEIQWRPDQDGALSVHAEIEDRAKNRAQIDETVAPTASADDGPKTAATPTPAVPSTSVATPGGDVGRAAPRDPEKPLMVNSTSFELDYDLGRTSPSQVEKIEVWGTRDDGMTWLLLGLDEDRRSPCAVSVDREGRYGFTILVATADARPRPPQSGEPPEIRVGVDLSVPRVRLTIAEPDVDGRPCALNVKWEATDEHLGPQSVSLAYSAKPQGPWLPLAVGIPNSGSHVCRFDPQGPDTAYLRIEVRDDAGNLGAFTTTTPIPIEKRTVRFHFAGNNPGDGKQTRPKWFHVLR